jgi:hypothetical protein
MLSESTTDPILSEVAAWNVFDANVRLGHSGTQGELALETPELIGVMNRFAIHRAPVSHLAMEEYDAREGNLLLLQEVELHLDRLEPVWGVLPEPDFIEWLSANPPAAVRLCPAVTKHNFSCEPWCAGELAECLQHRSILALIALEDIGWEQLLSLLRNFPRLPVLLLETGYRADRWLFPLLRLHSGLYVETSTYVAHRQLENFVDRLGPDRLMFGSCLPFYTPGAALAVLATACIPDESRLKIAGGNLRRLIAQETRGKRREASG